MILLSTCSVYQPLLHQFIFQGLTTEVQPPGPRQQHLGLRTTGQTKTPPPSTSRIHPSIHTGTWHSAMVVSSTGYLWLTVHQSTFHGILWSVVDVVATHPTNSYRAEVGAWNCTAHRHC
eukprot:4000719-Amphidinium_carterae.1